MFTKESRKKLRAFNKATPTSLPPTMIQLGELFGASITLSAARRVESIEIRGSAYKGTNDTKIRPHYMVDVDIRKGGNGIDTRILRSHSDLTKRQARDLQREVTRKIAMFVWENRHVKLDSEGADIRATENPANDRLDW